jgi:hypothetical protein
LEYERWGQPGKAGVARDQQINTQTNNPESALHVLNLETSFDTRLLSPGSLYQLGSTGLFSFS